MKVIQEVVKVICDYCGSGIEKRNPSYRVVPDGEQYKDYCSSYCCWEGIAVFDKDNHVIRVVIVKVDPVKD